MREPTSIDRTADGPIEGHPCSISAYESGPFLVRGAFELLDHDGNRIGLRRRTIALCRCGRSRTDPFCDGTHKVSVTAAPPPAAG